MFNRMILLSSLVATMIILVMMNFTTPTSIGPLGVLVIFTMFYVVSFGLSSFITDFCLDNVDLFETISNDERLKGKFFILDHHVTGINKGFNKYDFVTIHSHRELNTVPINIDYKSTFWRESKADYSTNDIC